MSKSDNNDLPIFKNQTFLDLAFTHRSYLNENKKTSPVSNERLEFLGDSILSYVVSQYLYNHYSSWPEGQLTDLRTALVNRETLAKVARKLSLGKYLKLSHGEENSGGRENTAILANTFEALIAAIFFDQGIESVTTFLNQHLLPLTLEFAKGETLKDFKSLLQEKVQEKTRQSPQYRLLTQVGPDHAKTFEIGVYVDGTLLAKGKGLSKHKAELACAKKALEKYN